MFYYYLWIQSDIDSKVVQGVYLAAAGWGRPTAPRAAMNKAIVTVLGEISDSLPCGIRAVRRSRASTGSSASAYLRDFLDLREPPARFWSMMMMVSG